MSAVVLLTPVVVAAWPVFASAVVSAAASLGYTQAENLLAAKKTREMKPAVELEVANSAVLTDQLGRDEKIVVSRESVTITFRRDARGKASLTVTGEGHSDEALRAMGEELSKRVIQRYVYQQIMAEMAARDFVVVEDTVDESYSIHLTVRHWEN